MKGRLRLLWLGSLALGALLALPLHRFAASAQEGPAVADLDDAGAIAAWRARLDEGWDRVAVAHQLLEAARDTYADWRQRKYPRGVRKEKLVAEVAAAETELAEAQAAWQELFEDARRAGVPPGVLRDYE